MDPFTQKLLERTQARKEQLAMKRMELAACRSKRNSPSPAKPNKPKQPLTEDNTDNKTSEVIKEADDCKRQRVLSDGSIPGTPESARKEAEDWRRPRVFSDSSVPRTPEAASKLKATTEINPDSPSIQARREKLLEMQKKDSAVTPKKHWKKAVDLKQSENSSPSIATISAAFENKAGKQCPLRQEGTPNHKTLLATPKTPVTPGKLAAARNIFEKGSKPISSTKNETKHNPIDPVGPPKPPRVADSITKTEKPAIKRKAPAPPTSSSDEEKSGGSNGVELSGPWQNSGYDRSIVSAQEMEPIPAKRKPTTDAVGRNTTERHGGSTPVAARKESKSGSDTSGEEVPMPKPRKRVQNGGDTIDGMGKTTEEKSRKELEDEKARRRQERKKARMENREQEVIVATAEVVNLGKSKQKECSKRCTREEKVKENVTVVNYKAHAVENNCSSVAVVKVVPVCQQKEIQRKSVKIVSIGNVEGPSCKKEETKEICGALLEAVAMEEESIKQHKVSMQQRNSSQSQKGQDHQFKVPNAGPFRLQGSESHLQVTEHPSVSGEDVLDETLNETVNLNDVNIHEMTFTFDFSTFDEIQEDRETKFQKSYNEKQKELEKEKPASESSSSEYDSSEAHSSESTRSVEEVNMGVYKSGYNSQTGDQYATKMMSKIKPPVPERPMATHDRLKELLDQAASQQNILLQMSQALNMCDGSKDIFGGSQEEVEAERVLLLAAERKQAHLNEHLRLKTRPCESMRSHREGYGRPCPAMLSISGIQISLRQEFMDVLRVGIRQDLGVFHFVCHIQNGPLEILSTETLSTNDCTEGNFLTFSDKFVLKDLDPNFAVIVKVFGMNVQKNFPSVVSTASKHKFFQSPKVGKNKRRGMDGASPGPGGTPPLPVFRTPSFKLVGIAHIALPVISSKKIALDRVPQGCPLHNHIQMNLHCMPQYNSHVKGFLTILEDIGGYSAWQRRWCVLEGGMLSYWRYPGDESAKPPIGVLDLGQSASDHITTVSRDLCARPHTMEIKINKSEDNQVKYLLACDTKADRVTWLDCLNEALKDYKAWSTCHNKALYPDLGHMVDKNAYSCSNVESERH